ncbi:hypothetical protein JXB27_00560 [Candidatus Woesearchaeota archaeon]|nr:hypothetical protein [Candidatus Woesearchaeota archaeon]
MEFKRIFKKGRVLVLAIFLVLAVLSINPHPFNEGAAIRSVEFNSSASIAGIENPKANLVPLKREVIEAINNEPVKTIADYYSKEALFEIGEPVQVKTNKGLYKLITKEKDGKPNLGMVVLDAPKSNLRLGLDLQGGTRIILEPQEKISDEDMDILLLNLNQRLNVYGLSDITVRPTSDLEGNKYILIEVAGGNDQEVIELVGKQGKFEAKVSNQSVFKGGNDVTYVCRSADCSGLSPYRAPQQIAADQWTSTFEFSITLSREAAEKMASVTKNLKIEGEYLSESIILYLDDKVVDELKIGSSLKGQAVTNIAISGPGIGRTRAESQLEALKNMKNLQTILITGSLPVKLDIVKTDTISPVLGKEFVQNAVKMLLIAIAAVTVIILIRYKKPSIVIPVLITTLSEVALTLGTLSLFGANLDIAGIAGILVAIGTGVNDQIIILDELTLKQRAETNWIKRMKNAFFIIVAAYLTAVVSMIPLLFAGAGLLKGFAITSIVGVTVGVLITRPAFGAVAEELYKE